MRKVTKTVVGAFERRQARRCGNTFTDGERLVLHGHTIAEWRGGDKGGYVTCPPPGRSELR